MVRTHLAPLKPFTTIGEHERANVLASLKKPLSGYIGGNPRGGYWVERLSDEWRGKFDVAHAIPCNSATSGLLAACMAIGVNSRTEVWTTPYSMSATAACARVLGAKVRFTDIETDRFGIDPKKLPDKWPPPKAIIVTNLFGHPAYLKALRQWCEGKSVWLIEDNAQAPMAMEEGRYTGTIGHIGVFSLNVHKHIQCGEGGVIVTNHGPIGAVLKQVINHGELSEYRMKGLGLNLRMTEPIAAIACAQLQRAPLVIEGRRDIGLELCDIVKDVPWIKAHTDQPECRHVYYLWTALVEPGYRGALITSLMKYGVPIRGGYAPLLNKLFKSGDDCPTAWDVDRKIIVFEVCAYSLPRTQMKVLREIMKRVTGEIDVSEGQRLSA